MANRDVNEAFDSLLNELNAVLTDIREQVAEASRQGKYTVAQGLIERAQQTEKFIREMQAQHKTWQRITGRARTKVKGKRLIKRLPRGTVTPRGAYRLPILRALVALGGEAKMQEVLESVYTEMQSGLKPVDFDNIPSAPDMPRWRHMAMSERLNMVREGLLRGDSPRGVWGISERGAAYLGEHGG